MRGMWGNKLGLSIFGESHGPAIGLTISGLPAGIALDEEAIALEMARRAPGQGELSTPRREADAVRIVSGLYAGKTNGAPLCGMIENKQARSGDYEQMKHLMRPGHADYPAYVKYHGFSDPRGGGHFSGRLTAPLVFGGAVARQMLSPLGVEVAAHIAAIGGVRDTALDAVQVTAEDLRALRGKAFPVNSLEVEAPMRAAVLRAKAEGDSVGGEIACAGVGIRPGLGEPFFGGVEAVLSGLLFSIPAVKAVSFGLGEGFAALRGSQANDAYLLREGKIQTRTNHNGGILGGITNGMPLLCAVSIKPTPSIAIEQDTVDVAQMRAEKLSIGGRHDPCIVQRAVPVVEAAVLLGLLSFYLEEGLL